MRVKIVPLEMLSKAFVVKGVAGRAVMAFE